MNKEKVMKMVEDPRYISGIYNYCDRWCERCEFTSRCLNYAFGQEEEKAMDPKARDSKNKEFWDHLSGIFALTMEMITDYAKENNIDLNSDDVELRKEMRKLKRRATSTVISRQSHEYAIFLHKWLKSKEPMFEAKSKSLIALAESGVAEDEIEQQAREIADACEVVRWYQFQIHVKLVRAQHQEPHEIADLKIDRQDGDGSAKVALIGIDRSIAAWGILRKYFAEEADAILDILIDLDRLRRRIEKKFPHARRFIRPGFDEPVREKGKKKG
jgi:hypothetical protein